MSGMDAKPTKPSEPAAVDAWMAASDHPLLPLGHLVRRLILETDPVLGEEIKWNAPSFFYTGPMRPFDPKEHKRTLLNFNVFQKDCLRLVFVKVDHVPDPAKILEGDYKDGRRLVLFRDEAEVERKKAALQEIIRGWLERLDRD